MEIIKPKHFDRIVDLLGDPYQVQVGYRRKFDETWGEVLKHIRQALGQYSQFLEVSVIVKKVDAEQLKKLYRVSIHNKSPFYCPVVIDPDGDLHNLAALSPKGIEAAMYLEASRWDLGNAFRPDLVIVTPNNVIARFHTRPHKKLEELAKLAAKHIIPISISKFDESKDNELYSRWDPIKHYGLQ